MRRSPAAKESIMKKLGSLNKAAAWLIAAAMVLTAVFGIGGLKLSSKYNKAEKNFNKACSAASGGGSFDGDLASVMGFAGQIEAAAVSVLGSDNSSASLLTKALENIRACSGDHAKAFVAAEELYSAVEGAYSAINRADPEAAKGVYAAVTNFRSGCDIIRNTYTAAYIEYNGAINDLKGGFPTSVIKSLWGIGPNEE